MNHVVGLTLSLFLIVPGLAFAQVTLEKLKNDKEVVISAFDEKATKEILKKFGDQSGHESPLNVFRVALKKYLETSENQCELGLIEQMKNAYQAAKYPVDEKSLNSYFKLARIHNVIDDMFYLIIASDNRDYFDLQKLDLDDKVGKADNRWPDLYKYNNVKDLFSNFEPYPDEKQLCAYQEYIYLLNNIVSTDGKKPEKPRKTLGFLNKKALEDKVISLATFHKLEFLRKKSEVNDRHIFLREYLSIVARAKNSLVPNGRVYKPLVLTGEDKFSSERMKRFSHLTRRELLYRKYDETQIILLAQILQKASRRMGVDMDTKTGVPYITQEFDVTEKNGEHRTYVETIQLDPQSQFNYARRMLRKDMTETQMMEMFIGLKITYTDIVMAAFETGYISIEDIAYVVRYDDLWNPETSKFERISGFIFKVSGYATFFLPPPWNVVGTLALGIVEGIVDNKNKSGADNDNPATFIE